MPQSVPHRTQSANQDVEFVRLGGEHLPVDPHLSARPEHARDFVQGETGGAPDPDQRQSLQHARIEKPAEAAPSDRGDQPLLLIISERRRGYARPLGHLRNIQITHPLDLKLT